MLRAVSPWIKHGDNGPIKDEGTSEEAQGDPWNQLPGRGWLAASKNFNFLRRDYAIFFRIFAFLGVLTLFKIKYD